MKKDRFQQLKKIRDEIWNLNDSPLYRYRIENHYYPVIGEGSHEAAIMFVGEAPGRNEAKTGRPFCGAAGAVLDELLESIEVPRSQTYITNIVKDRPPQNRDPSRKEIECYAPFLIRQIEIIKPEAIVSLGRFSMRFIMEHFGLGEEIKPISRIHGKTFEAESSYGKVKIIPLFHPAVAVYNPNKFPLLKEDFAILKNYRQMTEN
jgi:uracil-DNA glycosylase family 4